MTVAQRLIQEGLEKGLQRGREEGLPEGRQEALRGLQLSVVEVLTVRFGDIFDYAAEQIKAINSIETLKSLHRQALLVKNKEDFSRSLDKLSGERSVSTKDVFNDVVQKFIQEGLEKGLQMGREEGRQEGRQEGIRGLQIGIIEILTARFGDISCFVTEQIKASNSIETLKTLHRQALLVENKEDLSRSLNKLNCEVSSSLKDEFMTVAQKLVQEGLEKGLQLGIIEILTVRFGDISRFVTEQIKAINSIETLKFLQRQALLVKNKKSFARLIKKLQDE